MRRSSRTPEPIAWSPPALLYERTPGAASAPVVPDAIYRRHESDQTTLYRVVEDNLETVLAEARLRTEHGYGYPRFVEQTFRDYLACGRRELDTLREKLSAGEAPAGWVGLTEAAKRLGLSKQQVAYLVKREKLPAVRVRVGTRQYWKIDVDSATCGKQTELL